MIPAVRIRPPTWRLKAGSMTKQAAAPHRTTGDGLGLPARLGPRVAVVFESGRRGAAALALARELLGSAGELSVLTLAPQADPLRCCGGGGAGPYNCAVHEEAELELEQARKLLGSRSSKATFVVLAGSPDPPLSAWVAEHAVEVVILPARRFSRGGGRLARSARRAATAEVRLVG